MADISIVVTESVILKLKTDTKIKNVAKLHAWACLPALEKIKHSLEYNEQVTMQFRSAAEGRKPWIFAVSMNQNSQDCIALVLRRIKMLGIKAQKGFDKKRKIRESEVTSGSMAELKIETLLTTIEEWEAKLQYEKNSQTVNHLIALYNKAVEYYSALNDERHMNYLMKVKKLF